MNSATSARNEAVKKIYPDGMHAAIAKGLSASKDFTCRTATLDEPEHGLAESVLKETDVLVWWGHIAHGDVKDEVVKRVQQQVLSAWAGRVALGTLLEDLPRVDGHELLAEMARSRRDGTHLEPRAGHPITEGLGEYFELHTKRCTASDSTFRSRTS